MTTRRLPICWHLSNAKASGLPKQCNKPGLFLRTVVSLFRQQRLEYYVSSSGFRESVKGNKSKKIRKLW
ncbi:hypothetical protein Tsp_10771, partial [Trichinella spiralis]|uniref:hypothetical protein n=1 Tax=Trichinella spiralis TaxID=6334 RepID=UPI0001EFD4E7